MGKEHAEDGDEKEVGQTAGENVFYCDILRPIPQQRFNVLLPQRCGCFLTQLGTEHPKGGQLGLRQVQTDLEEEEEENSSTTTELELLGSIIGSTLASIALVPEQGCNVWKRKGAATWTTKSPASLEYVQDFLKKKQFVGCWWNSTFCRNTCQEHAEHGDQEAQIVEDQAWQPSSFAKNLLQLECYPSSCKVCSCACYFSFFLVFLQHILYGGHRSFCSVAVFFGWLAGYFYGRLHFTDCHTKELPAFTSMLDCYALRLGVSSIF